MELLDMIRELCREAEEVDLRHLAAEAGLTPEETRARVEALEAAGLVTTEEYAFSCSEELYVRASSK